MPKLKGAVNSFADISEGMYYTDAVKWAASAGIVKGIDAEIFAPDELLSGEEVAMMLYGYAKYKGMNTESDAGLTNFSDHVSVSGWALPANQSAKGNGIINGKSGELGVSERLLDPKGNATRAEIAVILKGFIERQNKF